MLELAAAIPFVFLAALLVYVVLQVPLTRDDVVDLRDVDGDGDLRLATFPARLVFVTRHDTVITLDGATLATGEPFTLEVGRQEGWALDDVEARLRAWAGADTLVDVTLRDELRGTRAWITCGQDALDLPVRGALGVQSTR